MLKTKEDNSDFCSKIIIEVPLLKESIEDCYSFFAMNAPSEVKSMLIEALGETIDKIILDKRPNHFCEEWLKKELNSVKLIPR